MHGTKKATPEVEREVQDAVKRSWRLLSKEKDVYKRAKHVETIRALQDMRLPLGPVDIKVVLGPEATVKEVAELFRANAENAESRAVAAAWRAAADTVERRFGVKGDEEPSADVPPLSIRSPAPARKASRPRKR
ncbi:MAG: hypothetical protein K8I02_12510 [Candidatus Methylomirabilis sp.]|nr:hypothetical protein [Deltaproteobacteria bacterium]